jgi:hypothetical protein
MKAAHKKLSGSTNRRYYDLNLSQNFWVFGLGVLCIALGLSIVVFSLYLVLKVAHDTQSQIIVASLGAVGSILANYVGCNLFAYEYVCVPESCRISFTLGGNPTALVSKFISASHTERRAALARP